MGWQPKNSSSRSEKSHNQQKPLPCHKSCSKQCPWKVGRARKQPHPSTDWRCLQNEGSRLSSSSFWATTATILWWCTFLPGSTNLQVPLRPKHSKTQSRRLDRLSLLLPCGQQSSKAQWSQGSEPCYSHNKACSSTVQTGRSKTNYSEQPPDPHQGCNDGSFIRSA